MPSPYFGVRAAQLNRSARQVRRWFTYVFAAIVVSMSVPAHAHGTDVLVTIYAQAATIVAVLASVLLVPLFRRHWLGAIVGCIIGVAVSWMLTDEMPYRENRRLITAIDIALPIASAALFVWVARIHAARGGRA